VCRGIVGRNATSCGLPPLQPPLMPIVKPVQVSGTAIGATAAFTDRSAANAELARPNMARASDSRVGHD
jgi:hypothetical protein